MKSKFLLVAAAYVGMALTGLSGDEIKFDFADKTFQSAVRGKKCRISEDNKVLTLYGDTQDKNNSFRTVVHAIDIADVAGKKIEFGGEVKATITGGSFKVAIREVGEEQKSIRYEEVKFSKSQDWKEFEREFTVSAKAKSIQLYLIGANLPDDSQAEIKDLYYEVKDND